MARSHVLHPIDWPITESMTGFMPSRCSWDGPHNVVRKKQLGESAEVRRSVHEITLLATVACVAAVASDRLTSSVTAWRDRDAAGMGTASALGSSSLADGRKQPTSWTLASSPALAP